MKKKLGFDLILLGAPASGKDTQAKLLEKKYALKPVESGDYLRALARNKTKIGGLLSNNFAKGHPAPTKLIKEFLATNLKFPPKNANYIFVGNPRLKPEAEFLVKELNKKQRNFFVLFIKLPQNEIWKRSAKRLRDDQDLHYVKTRINYHKYQVAKTVAYFRKQKKLEFIDGNQTIASVNKDILKAINQFRKS